MRSLFNWGQTNQMDVYHSNIASSRFANPERKKTYSTQERTSPRSRKIEAEEIEEAICNGTIIEPYPDDPRGASCLVLDFATRDRSLHVICGRLEEDEVLIITAYEPDPKEWEADWKTRKKGD